jgi:hypothetical protein
MSTAHRLKKSELRGQLEEVLRHHGLPITRAVARHASLFYLFERIQFLFSGPAETLRNRTAVTLAKHATKLADDLDRFLSTRQNGFDMVIASLTQEPLKGSDPIKRRKLSRDLRWTASVLNAIPQLKKLSPRRDYEFMLACDIWKKLTGAPPSTRRSVDIVPEPALEFLKSVLALRGWPEKSLTLSALKGRLYRTRKRRIRNFWDLAIPANP